MVRAFKNGFLVQKCLGNVIEVVSGGEVCFLAGLFFMFYGFTSVAKEELVTFDRKFNNIRQNVPESFSCLV